MPKMQKVQCPECKEMFKGPIGRATHMRKAHSLNPDGTTYHFSEKEKVAKQKREIVKHKVVKRQMKKEHENAAIPIELYVYVGSKLEEIIHRVAYEHELVEKQFARGFLEHLQRT